MQLNNTKNTKILDNNDIPFEPSYMLMKKMIVKKETFEFLKENSKFDLILYGYPIWVCEHIQGKPTVKIEKCCYYEKGEALVKYYLEAFEGDHIIYLPILKVIHVLNN